MHFSYGFDIGVQEITLSDYNFMAELHVSDLPGRLTGEPEMRRAMAEPIGSLRLRACANSGNKVVILSALEKGDSILPSVMPAILDELYTGGVRRKDITLLLPYSTDDFSEENALAELVGERTVREILVNSIDLNDTVPVAAGEGLPVPQMVRPAAEADLRVLIGNVQHHSVFGYTGGSETLISSACPVTSINELLSFCKNSGTGSAFSVSSQKEVFDTVAKTTGANFCIEMVRGIDGSIKNVCAGDLSEAHKEGIRYLNAMCLKKLPCPADIVVTCPGGLPLDSDLIHSLPALEHAHNAVCNGGSIIFIASCKNGFGSPVLEDILLNAESAEDLTDLPNDLSPDIREACSILVQAQTDCKVWFVSDQEDPLFDKIFPNRKANAQAALNAALNEASSNALVLSMPYGLHTVPVLPGNHMT